MIKEFVTKMRFDKYERKQKPVKQSYHGLIYAFFISNIKLNFKILKLSKTISEANRLGRNRSTDRFFCIRHFFYLSN